MANIGDFVLLDGLVYRITAVSTDETPKYTLEPIRRKVVTPTKTVTSAIKQNYLIIGEGDPLTGVLEDDFTVVGQSTAAGTAIVDGYVRVRFESNGGTAIASQVILEGAKVVAPSNPTRAHYTFDAWYSDVELTTPIVLASATFDEDAVVYAKWIIDTFTVTFNTNGGSAVQAQTVDYNDTADKPADPTKSSYLFDAWYSDAGLTEEFDFETPITASITLYAGWDDAVIITFVSNGGTEVDAQTILVGAKATEPADPTLAGNVFDGWYYDDNTFTEAVDFAKDVFAEDDTLYAKWTPEG